MMNTRPWSIRTLLPLAAAVLSATAPAVLAEPPPQKIDVSKFTSQVNDVVIPNPSEVFAALDKMGSPNWHNVLLPTPTSKPKTPADIAMLLGDVIANGFVAVEAKDKTAIDDIGRKVIELATGLGVRDNVLGHSNAIVNAAKVGEWATVRSELDKAKSSVTGAMDKINSRDESELISIAGWLRGTQALTTLILADYKPERAELLHQPDILTTFEKQFDRMGNAAKSNKRVVELHEGLKKVKALILAGGNEPLSQKAVEEINGITTELLKTIER